jgi:phosphate transport system protein
MFKQLIEALTKKDALGEMIDQFREMLDAGQWLFEQSSGVVEGTISTDDVREEIYARDRKINQLERAIREKVVVHLVTGHDPDIGICLILMSVVKDAERIGDYCKNVFQLGEMFTGQYARAEYTTPLADIAKEIDGMFPLVGEAFSEAKKKKSRSAVEESQLIRKKCDMLVGQLLTPGGVAAPDEAAALVMRARFFKRVAAHLGNIATSVDNPVPMLDYNKNKPLDEPGD